MALTPSTMLPLGTVLPEFSLPDLDGSLVSSGQLQGAPVLVAFLSTHCPYVRHIQKPFAQFAREYRARGLAVIGVGSNDATTHPEDGPAGMARDAKEQGYEFPYLHDESQAVAKSFKAACTPDLFLFDAGGRLVYRGQFDDSRPGNHRPVTGADLRAAADAVLAGRPVTAEQKASIGCNIKWKRGNEPTY